MTSKHTTQDARPAHSGSTGGHSTPSSDRLASIKDHYDLIVIGSGLAGMTAANVMGRNGRSVLLLESHSNYGGLATWFKRRGGHIFDVSLHGFPVGMKKTCRKYWSQEIADDIVPLDGVRFVNPQFNLETSFTRDDFTRILVEELGQELEQVESFYTHLRRMDFYDDSGQTVGELFEQFFPGRNDVHRLLMEPISYANGSTLDDPAITYGIVFSNFMSKGVYTFRGGTDQLIARMRRELVSNGVDLRNHVTVDRIRLEPGAEVWAAKGVEVGERFIAADAVLSNANLKSTILDMLDPAALKPEFLEEVRAVRLNNSSCQVYFGLRDGATLPFVGDLIFTSTRETFDSPSLCDMHGESRTFSFYYPKTRPGSERYTVVASTNARYEDWAELDQVSYEREKQRMIDETLACLEGLVPGISADIEHAEAATPRTFKFYTRHLGGSSFGTKFEGLRPSMELHEEVPGLYHAGSVGIIMSGWLGAANYGVIQASKIDSYLHARALSATPTT
ncbi:MAG: FAD-dependent oxidoreductase [Planctomycetota bacterium]|jgi:phytoene dehydrogenase-like protein|nr:phytoene dehydrogenase [Planctomycetota bacterium]MDP6369822.1 FAD-dependent oxidoreductase [Planctomycetota bacterium]